MPETDSDELYSPQARGALRYRPISTGVPAMTDQPRIQRASRMRNTTTDEPRPTQGPRQETAEASQTTPNQSSVEIETEPCEENKHRSPLLRRFQSIPQRTRMVGIFMASIIVTLLIVFLYQQAANLVTVTWDDLHYGRPRTFQVDAFVGHETGNTPSHFMVVNLRGHIEIVELPGGNATHVQEYSGPQLVGPNAELVPPTLQFVDTNQGRSKDMILRAGDIQVFFQNVSGSNPSFVMKS